MMSTRITLGLLALGGGMMVAAFALVAPTGCTVLSNDEPPDDAGPFEGGDDADVPSCSTCVESECVGLWAVCLLDQGCRTIQQCVSGGSSADTCASCGTGTDGGNDADAGPDPLGAYAAFASCNDARTCTTCSDSCTSSCASGSPKTTPSCGPGDAGPNQDAGLDAGDAGRADAGDAGDASSDAGDEGGVDSDAGSPGDPAAACTACVARRCADPKRACAVGTECASFLACAYGCTTAACSDDCGTRYATGKQAAAELSSCTVTDCRGLCGL